MENIMVDSCVFFKMIEFNNFVEKYGKEHLDEYLKLKYDKLNNLKSEIENCFFDDFLKRNKNMSFDEMINDYKEFSTSKRNQYLLEAESNLRLSQGIVYVKGEEKKMNFPEEKKQMHYQKYLDAKAKYDSITPYDDIQEKINKYKTLKDIIYDGIVYKKALDGEYKLYTNYISFAEIKNHTVDYADREHWLHFTESEVDLLTKHFGLVKASDEKVMSSIDELAKAYRTSNGNANDKAMDEDINSVGDYGDSKIAAIANLSGMTLITQNGKDFIFDKSVGRNNENIKNHLKNENKKYHYTTNATVYLPEDILSESYNPPEPTKNHTFVLTPVKEFENKFDSELEIIL